jgi:DNA-directed RNA polymerase specialized sigma24 family protein
MVGTTDVEAILLDDATLVARSIAGSREAFGRIVSRYQSLVSAVAYSATGSISHSEDLAQETFLTAWRDLCTPSTSFPAQRLEPSAFGGS